MAKERLDVLLVSRGLAESREKAKAIHNAYCDYEIAEAKSPSRIYSVRAEIKTKSGVKTHNMSKAMLLGRILSYSR